MLDIEQKCFSLPWAEAQLHRAFAQQAFMAFGLGRLQLLGYISLYHIADQVEILNIAVVPAYQRQGHGTRLLNHVLRYMKKIDMQSVVLEVRESNRAARALYARSGFAQVGLRKQYYADTGEDALVLACDILTVRENGDSYAKNYSR